jgi:peptidoglycan/xylan/chitin deacetylase (PgdA/CDA1 family)
MTTLKSIFLAGLSILGLPRDRAVILMYHSIGPANGYFWNVTLPDFERQMAYIASTGKAVISLAELVRRLRAGEKLGSAVAITFDDGYHDNYTNARPVLEKYRFPATVFVETDAIGRLDKRGFRRMSETEIREMKTAGVDIQPHSQTHPRLGEVDSTRLREEIEGSKRAIEAILGKTADLFAYPYGSFSDESQRVLKECGFAAATTVGEGTVHSATNPFMLPRVSIDSSTSFAQFRGKLSRAIDVYENFKKVLKV